MSCWIATWSLTCWRWTADSDYWIISNDQIILNYPIISNCQIVLNFHIMLNYWINWKFRWTADRQFTPSLSTWPSMRLSLKNFSLSSDSTSPPVGWTIPLWRLGPVSQERWFWVLIHQELCKRYKLSPEMAATTTYLEELYTRNLSKEVNIVHWTILM